MKRILVVDDSPAELFCLKEILNKHDFDVIEAFSGADGVTLAEEKKPDLIIIDLVMPGMNGFQVTRQISCSLQTQHIPIIIVSTKDQDINHSWGKQQGAKHYLVKPINETKLIEIIDQYLS